MSSACTEEGCLLKQLPLGMVAYPAKSTLAAVPPESILDHCVTHMSKVPLALRAGTPWAWGASMICQDKCSAVPGLASAQQLTSKVETRGC